MRAYRKQNYATGLAIFLCNLQLYLVTSEADEFSALKQILAILEMKATFRRNRVILARELVNLVLQSDLRLFYRWKQLT